MKYCPTCGKELRYDTAEICPTCGCRIAGPQDRWGRIITVFLAAIFIVLSIIAVIVLQLPAPVTGKDRAAPVTTIIPTPPADPSVSVAWDSADDWSRWEHAATWAGPVVGPCAAYGPVIVQGHGEYGADVNLRAGSAESAVWRTFTDPTGNGWNTLTFVGRMPPVDTPRGRWMRIEINDQVVFSANASQVPPGNWDTFTLPVHFPQAKTVKVKISNGQQPAWGGANHPFRMDYYSLRLGLEEDGNAAR